MNSKQHRAPPARVGSRVKGKATTKEKMKEPKKQKPEKQITPISELIKAQVAEAKRRQNILEDFFKTRPPRIPPIPSKQKYPLNSRNNDIFLKSILTKDTFLKSRKLATETKPQAKKNAPSKIKTKRFGNEDHTKKTRFASSADDRLRKFRKEESKLAELSRDERLKKSTDERLKKVAEQTRIIEERLKKFSMDEMKSKLSKLVESISKDSVKYEKTDRTMNTDSVEESGEMVLRQIDLQTCSKCNERAVVPENVVQVKRTTSSAVFMDGIQKLSNAIMKELQGNAKKKLKIISVDSDEDDGEMVVLSGNDGDGVKVVEGRKKGGDVAPATVPRVSDKWSKTSTREEMMSKMQDTNFITFNEVRSESKNDEHQKERNSQLPVTGYEDTKIMDTDGSPVSSSKKTNSASEENSTSAQDGLRKEDADSSTRKENPDLKKDPLAYYIGLNNLESAGALDVIGNEIEKVRALQDEINKIQSYIEKSIDTDKPERSQLEGDKALSKISNCLDIINNLKSKFPMDDELASIAEESLEQGDAVKKEPRQVKPVQCLKKKATNATNVNLRNAMVVTNPIPKATNRGKKLEKIPTKNPNHKPCPLSSSNQSGSGQGSVKNKKENHPQVPKTDVDAAVPAKKLNASQNLQAISNRNSEKVIKNENTVLDRTTAVSSSTKHLKPSQKLEEHNDVVPSISKQLPSQNLEEIIKNENTVLAVSSSITKHSEPSQKLDECNLNTNAVVSSISNQSEFSRKLEEIEEIIKNEKILNVTDAVSPSISKHLKPSQKLDECNFNTTVVLPSIFNQSEPTSQKLDECNFNTSIFNQSELSRNSEEIIKNENTILDLTTAVSPLSEKLDERNFVLPSISNQLELSRNLEEMIKNRNTVPDLTAAVLSSISKHMNQFCPRILQERNPDVVSSIPNQSEPSRNSEETIKNENSVLSSKHLNPSQKLEEHSSNVISSISNQSSCSREMEKTKTDVDQTTAANRNLIDSNAGDATVLASSSSQPGEEEVQPSEEKVESSEEKVHPIFLIALRLSKISERLEMILEETCVARSSK